LGLFQKKLDYSSGNGILPKLSESEYLNLRAPSSSMVRVPNLDLMSREQDLGNLDAASEATADEAFSDSNETIIKITVEKYLAEGFVTWKPSKPGPTPNAPLILHPIKIEPTARGNSDFQLAKGEHAFFNQALLLLLEKDFGIDPRLFDFEGEISMNSPEVADLAAAILGIQEWQETVGASNG
jgi:hypothetical protein